MNMKTPIDIEAIKQDILRRRLLATAVPNRQLDSIPIADRAGVIPLSSAQQRLWFIDQLDPAGGSAYHVPTGLRFRGELDVAALKWALDRIVARHENLRTTFAKVDGSPRQVIAPESTSFGLVEQDLQDLGGLDPQSQTDAVLALANKEARAPFDLEAGPLIRGRLLRLAADDHVLLLTMHHIVSDGWSIGVLVREFSTLYTAHLRGEPDPLPPLPIQYADYAVWQRAWLQGEALQRQLGFWRGHLSGAPALLELPTDRPRPPVQSYAGGAALVELPAELVQDIRSFSKRHGATAFMTLLASWSVLLSRLSGQSDIVVGSPAANRQRAELAPLTGFFVNTLALRTSLEGDPSVADMMAQVKRVALEAYSNQETPIELVFEALQPVRSMSHSTLFQTMLAFNNTPSGGVLGLPGLSLSGVEMPNDKSRFDMTLSLTEIGDRIGGGLEYASDLFDAATIERWLGYWQRLLAAMVADDTQRVGAMPLLDAEERHLLLETFNSTATRDSSPVLLHMLFEAQVERSPEAIAVEQDGEQISYAQLNSRANRLAHHLVSLGVKADDRVAVCVDRSVEMLVGLLGILKAGGAYVPLDPSYPSERLAYLLSDSEPVALLTQAALRESIEGWSRSTVPMVLLDGEEAASAWGTQPCANPDPEALGITPASLAYVIYTSGSTGQPKGVMVEHAQVANLVAAHVSNCELTDGDRVLQFSSFSFDASVEEIFPVLAVGATVVLRPTRVMPDRSFTRLLEQNLISVVELPTAFWHQWVGSAGFAGSLATTKVRLVVIGGEMAEAGAFSAWLAGCSGHSCPLLNTYGPTEATVYATAIRLDDDGIRLPVVPIGKPVRNVRIYILDECREPTPIGVVGEIYISGAQLARGYLKRPELTRERFVDDAFAGGANARMYRTGDIGRWRPDGSIEYLGRNDEQVKIRGFRIELGEIQEQLQRLPGVRAAAVLAREDMPGGKRLVAYVVPRDDAAPTASELRELLAIRLPEYMLPSAFVRLEALPLTANGKLDRAALPAPGEASVAKREYEAPIGEIEHALASIWQELLGLERVGRNDHFFELGGHSLMAVQVVARVNQRLRIDLPLRELFAHPTLAFLSAAAAKCGAVQQPALVRVDRERSLPLSWAQQRLWFLDRLDSAAGDAYQIPTALRLRGRLDQASLQAALDRIVARHEILRTRLVGDEATGTAHQMIGGVETGFALAFEDCSSWSDECRDALVHDRALAETQAPFDLAVGPLVRGRLLRIRADEHVLLLTMHHTVSDGWSMGVLVREVVALYGAFVRGEDDPLPSLPIQYADYAVWQRNWLQGEVLERQLAFWRDHLDGAPALLDLPIDRPRPALPSYRGASVGIALPLDLATGVKALGQRHGTTTFMTLLASWAVLLSRLSGQADVVVGTPVANRQRTELESLIGFFVNTLALRVRLGTDPSVAELLAQVRESTLEAYAHQDLPFEQVVEALRPVRSLGHSPLFQVMLSLNNVPGADALALPEIAIEPLPLPGEKAHFDLSLSCTETADGLVASLNYATDLHDAASMQRLLDQWQRVLAAMVADDARRTSTLPLLGDEECHDLLHAFQAPAADYPRDALVHALFEAQCARSPDAIAVEYDGEQFTYAQLNARANRLAHHLLALGVAPDARVALHVERGIDMVAGVLGILKAGGAYVPLDPAYPVERLAYMLADSEPVALLTRSSLKAIPADQGGAGRPVVMLDDEETFAGQPQSNPDPRAQGLTSANLAYVIYTSGSTGQPKGVMVEHRSVVNLGLNLDAQVFASVSSQGRIGLNAALSFDASVQSLTQLFAGRCIVIVPQAVRRDPAALCRFVGDNALEALDCTPAQLEQLLEDAELEQRWPKLRTLLVGGDVLSARGWARLSAWEGVACWNVYGPTECTVDATAALIGGEMPGIGRPMANVPVRILDAAGAPVPVGVIGELHVGGVQVARGYLNRMDLTKERFVRDPYAPAPGARLYKTGDLGRWRPDGTIEFLGRNDDQVKVRGFRIEPGEIESQLHGVPEVQAAVVLVREDMPGQKRLVAYVVPRGASLPTAAQLRDRLANHLPEHMLPSAFVSLPSLPLTPGGKLDRAALPEPDDTAVARREYEAPIGEVEQALARIWQELLGLERVGRQDRFFELGGHSLMAVQVVARLRQAQGVELPLREIFTQPTLAALAQAVADGVGTSQPALVPADRSAPLPLSWAQQRLWFLDQMDKAAGAAYHMPMALRLHGELDRQSLQAAVDRIVARHESLRTTFANGADDDMPHQVIGPVDAGCVLAYEDLSALAPSVREALVHERGLEEAHAPFDLSRGPLIRGRVLCLSADEHVLLVAMHHIVSDGWSMGVLVREVGA
ncbi:non-ribosomal peptide synthetase, partial [Cognatiluteimonas telluris]|uniref:non-ribosomal peptide synthetase n=1 Tax=Cognatiluteimonas telluris TaxID=1104775 RepID=UPI0014085E78